MCHTSTRMRGNEGAAELHHGEGAAVDLPYYSLNSSVLIDMLFNL